MADTVGTVTVRQGLLTLPPLVTDASIHTSGPDPPPPLLPTPVTTFAVAKDPPSFDVLGTSLAPTISHPPFRHSPVSQSYRTLSLSLNLLAPKAVKICYPPSLGPFLGWAWPR